MSIKNESNNSPVVDSPDKGSYNITLFVVVLSFVFYIIVLYLIQPKWVQTIDDKGENLILSYELLVSYGVTFALITGILSLLLFSKQKVSVKEDVPDLMPYSDK